MGVLDELHELREKRSKMSDEEKCEAEKEAKEGLRKLYSKFADSPLIHVREFNLRPSQHKKLKMPSEKTGATE